LIETTNMAGYITMKLEGNCSAEYVMSATWYDYVWAKLIV